MPAPNPSVVPIAASVIDSKESNTSPAYRNIIFKCPDARLLVLGKRPDPNASEEEQEKQLILTKEPINGWGVDTVKRKQLRLEVIEEHARNGHAIGLIPASVGLGVIDLDKPEFYDAIDARFRQGDDRLAFIPSYSGNARRGHFWGRINATLDVAAKKVGNGKAYIDGESIGEIRCGGAYIVLWNPEAVADVVWGADNLPTLPTIKSFGLEKVAGKSKAAKKATNKADAKNLIEEIAKEISTTPHGNIIDDVLKDATKKLARAHVSKNEPHLEYIYVAMEERAAQPGFRNRTRTEIVERVRGLIDWWYEQHGKDAQLTRDAEGLDYILQDYGVKCRYNELAHKPQILMPGSAEWQEFDDGTYADLSVEVQARYKVMGKEGELVSWITSKENWFTWISAFARKNRVNPFIQYLDKVSPGLPAERSTRLDNLLHDAFDHKLGCSDELAQWASRTILMAAVARSRNNGVTVDAIPVLQGAVGIGKTRALQLLVPDEQQDWFVDNVDLLESEIKIQEKVEGAIIVEISEMRGARKAENEKIKALVSARFFKGRMAYARTAMRVPYRHVFVGSTNPTAVLNEDSGQRRFIPIPILSTTQGDAVEKHLQAVIAAHRDELWGEADRRVKAGESFRLPSGLLDEARAAGESMVDRHVAWDMVDTFAERLKNEPPRMYRPYEIALAAGYLDRTRSAGTGDGTTIDYTLNEGEAANLLKGAFTRGLQNGGWTRTKRRRIEDYNIYWYVPPHIDWSDPETEKVVVENTRVAYGMSDKVPY